MTEQFGSLLDFSRSVELKSEGRGTEIEDTSSKTVWESWDEVDNAETSNCK